METTPNTFIITAIYNLLSLQMFHGVNSLKHLQQYPFLYTCPLLQKRLGSEMLSDCLSGMNKVPLMVNRRLLLLIALLSWLVMFLAILMPSFPTIIWPSLVSFAWMPSRFTARQKLKIERKNFSLTIKYHRDHYILAVGAFRPLLGPCQIGMWRL